jgi:hypothetical protein
MKFLLFSIFMGLYCSPGSGSAFPMPIRIQPTKIKEDPLPDQDPQHTSDFTLTQSLSKYCGISLARASAVAAEISEGLMMTQLPADSAPKQ